MSDPRRASVRFLALLTLAAVAAALPLKHAAQNASAKKKQQQQQLANGKIVFQSTQGGDGFASDIYVMDADGKRQTRLTDSPSDDASPNWSPQGNQIAFVSNRRGGEYEVYLMNADGGNQRPLRAGAPVYAIDFQWSPDGTRLEYASGGDIYVVEVVAPGDGDSTAPPWSVSDGKFPGSSDTDASWSPDGSRLVISNSLACGGCSDLYTVNANGSGRAQLTTAPGFDASPRWSPDGAFVAYEADRGERGIYVIDAAGIGPEVKVSGDVGSLGPPTWASGGSRLAFTASTGVIHAVNSNGSGLTALSDMVGTCHGPFWSPDGQKVGFQNGGDIHVVNADGSSKRATNYTKSKRDDEFGHSWQRSPTQ